MRQLTVTVPGGRLSVIDEGDGPPILLLHAGIVDARAWDPLVPHLVAAGYRAIRFDARGYGQSETDDVPERSGGAHAGRSPSRRTRGSGVRRRAERRPGATAGPVRLIQSRRGPDVAAGAAEACSDGEPSGQSALTAATSWLRPSFASAKSMPVLGLP